MGGVVTGGRQSGERHFEDFAAEAAEHLQVVTEIRFGAVGRHDHVDLEPATAESANELAHVFACTAAGSFKKLQNFHRRSRCRVIH